MHAASNAGVPPRGTGPHSDPIAGAGRSDRPAAARSGEAAGPMVTLLTLSVPAHQDYLALARLAAVHFAAGLGVALDELADLRLAVDEACCLLLGAAGVGELALRFEADVDTLRVSVRGPVPPAPPDPEGIGWLLLCALVEGVRLEYAEDAAEVTLTASLSGRVSPSRLSARPDTASAP